MKYHCKHQPTKGQLKIHKKNLDNVRAVSRMMRELETPAERMQRLLLQVNTRPHIDF
jgi:hypothetical protein